MIVYLLIGSTILLTVAGQLLVKSAALEFGEIPTVISQIIPFLFRAFRNLKLIAGLSCAVLASITWMGAVSRSEISFAYPFMGLAIVLVLVLAPILFGETVPWTRWLGVLIVCLGLWIAAK